MALKFSAGRTSGFRGDMSPSYLSIPQTARRLSTAAAEGSESLVKPNPQASYSGPEAMSNAPPVSSYNILEMVNISLNISLGTTASPALKRLSCEPLLYPDKVVSIKVRMESTAFPISATSDRDRAERNLTEYVPPCA